MKSCLEILGEPTDLVTWIVGAQPGAMACYFKGHLLEARIRFSGVQLDHIMYKSLERAQIALEFYQSRQVLLFQTKYEFGYKYLVMKRPLGRKFESL